MTLSKKSAREDAKLSLKAVSKEIKVKWSNSLAKCFPDLLANISLSMQKDNLIIGAFAPMVDEINLFINFKEDEYKFAFPRIKDGKMVFCISKFADLIERDDFGVAIKVPKSDEEVFPSILLVPGLLFTKEGKRLGRGKGFYDKYLNRFSGIKVGLCFEMQVEDDLPVEEHDQEVDYLMTEKTLIKCSHN